MTYQKLKEEYQKYLEEFKRNKETGKEFQGDRPMTFKEFAPNVATRRG